MSDVTRRLAALTPEQRERLLLRMQNAANTSKEERIPRRADPTVAPLSFAQQRMWFLEQLLPNSPAYHIPVAVRLEGSLDPSALVRVIDWLVQRHEALRTTFPLRDGAPTQNILDSIHWQLEQFDASDDASVLNVLTPFVRKPFDLRAGPLMRVALVQLSAREHVLCVVLHHIVTDGWSMGVLVRDLVTAYSALASGVAPPFEAPSIQYGDFACWQRERVSDAKLESHVAHFRERLRDIEPLELPFDRPRPTVQSDKGATLPVALDEDVSKRLFALGQSQEASGFMLALSLFGVLLGRLSGQRRFGIGFPIAARSLRQLEPVVGLFANTLVARIDLRLRPTFRALIERTKAELLSSFAHQDAPFERIVGALEPERDTSRSPLFQAMLALGSSSDIPISSLSASRFPLEVGIAKFDLTLELDWAERGIRGTLEYNTDLFDATTAVSMRDRFARLAKAVVDEPDRPLDELEWLDVEEERSLLRWSRGSEPKKGAELLHSALERRASLAPDAIALVDGSQRLTYAALVSRARVFANELRQLALGQGVIALIAVPGIDTTVALLGISMAGAAYLPLDPELPDERLLLIARDADARAFVTPRAFEPRLRAAGLPVVVLPVGSSGPPASRRAIPTESLAYVIYTSGTTGTPKGVAVSHKSASLFAHAAAESFEHGPNDRVLQFHSLAFDVSIEEMFPTWCAGATVVLDSARRARSPEGLLELCETQGISVLDLPTSFFHAWVDALDANALSLPECLRLVVVGGEALGPDRVSRFHAIARDKVRLVNAYGPTEATVDVTLHRAEADSRQPPIGRPFGAARVFVLDARGQLVPPGIAGELHIGGECLAQSYLGRPDLTAERFVPSSFGTGERLYRTGDRARFRPDGELEFLGRVDHQIKLRGFRIELGEIEAALLREDGVLHAVVDVVSTGERRLVAWVVPRPGARVEPRALEQGLARALPSYMLPTAFEIVSELPLTAGGKIDRKRLPRPGKTKSSINLPQNDIERKLAAIFAKVLGVDQVDIEDSFFKLGGDSISGVQVAARARREGLLLDVRQIFQAPSVAELARVVKPLARRSAVARASRQSARLTPIQRWFFAQEPANPSHFNQALWLELEKTATPATLRAGLEEIVRQHAALRTRFVKNERGVIEQHVSSPSSEWFSEHAAKDDSELESIAEELQTSLAIETGPVFRAAFVRVAERCLLFLVAHHLVMDAVSLRILGDDLAVVLEQLAASKTPDLPPETTSYLDWAERLASVDVRGEVAYWREVGSTTVPPLPRDRAISRDPVGEMRSVSVSLDAAETNALLEGARRLYRTETVEVLLAAFSLAISRWANTSVVRLEFEAHGREAIADDVDISRTVGWFTTTFPLVLRLASDGALEPSLLGVKEQWRAVPRRGFGYGLLRYAEERHELGAESSDILFNYLGRVKGSTSEDGNTRLRLARAPMGPSIDSRFSRTHALDVSAAIVDDGLRVVIRHGRAHDDASIRGLANALATVLSSIEALTSPAATGRFTPSDFGLARSEQAELDLLAASLSEKGALGDVEDIYPLSPLQHGLLIDSFTGGDGLYVEQTGLFIEGALDLTALRAAFESVIARHTILRTTFEWEGLARPLQVVWTNRDLQYSFQSFEDLPAEQREKAAEAVAEADRKQRFDLGRGAFRVSAVRLSTSEHRLFITYHHILLDGWSTAALFAELASAYEAAREKERAPLAKPLPYRAYIEWILARNEKHSAEYWQKALRGFTEPTPLGIDRGGRGAAASIRCRTSLDAETTRALRDLGRARNLTESTLGHAAWALALGAYADRDDVVFGSTVSSRPAELQGVVSALGLYINTVPVRVRMDRRMSATEFLADVQRTLLEAQAHAYAPLSTALGAAEIPRDSALFSTSVVVENYPSAGALGQRADSPRIRKIENRESISIPLVLLVVPSTTLDLVCQFDPARFAPADVDALLQSVRRILEKLARDPDATVGRLLAPEAEETAAFLSRSSGPEHHERVSWVPDAIESHAISTPERIAVTSESGSLTFGELERRSNQLANHLRSLGVGPEVLVGIALERSLEQVVATLAVLKAGGAYVPLDPSYPVARLRFMLEDARVPVLVSDQRHSTLFDVTGKRLVLVDREDFASASDQQPPRTLHAGSAMYAIYTSGSTGTPKAALNTHAALANRLHWMQETYRLTEDDVVLHKTPFGFDVSGWELWWPLMTGARLVLARPGGEKDAEYLVELVRRERVTTLHFVPPMLSAFLEQDGAARCDSLRRVIASGETLSRTSVARFAERMPPQARLENLYGPTEAAIDVTRFACPRTEVAGVPIGTPIWNTRAYVLGRELSALPHGAIGELYLAGVQLARCYLQRPELTAERFLPDPFVAGERMYRTGDLARVNAEGQLEYIGRVDNQIKLRGYRIELGEIETALALSEHVQQAVVIVQQQPQAHIVGYVVPATASAHEASIRETLGRVLPAYMLPSELVFLDAFPLGATGKVDRKALPAPKRDSSGARSLPRNQTEATLARLVADALHLPEVDVHSDFFRLGGDSILALQVTARARAAGLSFTVRELFLNPTVSALAALARPEEALAAEPEPESAPCTPIQRWFFERQLPNASHFNQALWLELRADFTPERVADALREVVDHHPALRSRFADGVQSYAPAGPPILTQHDLGAISDSDLDASLLRIAEAEQRSLDIAGGPVFRAALVLLGERPARLFLVAHHLVIDTVSWRVIAEDLDIAGRALVAGKPCTLPPATTGFLTFAARSAELAAQPEIQDEVAMWQRVLAATPAGLPSRASGDNSLGSAAVERVGLDAEETRCLVREATDVLRVDVGEALLGALLSALAKNDATRRLRLDVEGHGRDAILGELDLTRTVGWFTTLYPLAFDLGSGLDGTLRAVKTSLRGIPHKGAGFGLLKAAGVDLGKHAPSRVLFNYLGHVASAPSEGELVRLSFSPAGSAVDSRAERAYELDVVAVIAQERLSLSVTYSQSLHDQARIREFCNDIASSLRAIIEASKQPAAIGVVPADFPLARVSQKALDKFLTGRGRRK